MDLKKQNFYYHKQFIYMQKNKTKWTSSNNTYNKTLTQTTRVWVNQNDKS